MSHDRSIQSHGHACTRPLRMLLTLLIATSLPAWAIDIPVDILGDPAPNGCTPGDCSLREAVTLANSLAGPDRILLPATPGLPLQLSIPGDNENGNATGDLDVLDDLEIVGTGAATTTLVQTVADRVLHTIMAVDKRITLRGLTIQGGNTMNGGAMQSGSLLTIEDAAFVGNRGSYEGGAINFFAGFAPAVTQPRLVLRRVRFENNMATGVNQNGTGGALYARTSFDNLPFVVIEDCNFVANESDFAGGAISMNGFPNGYGGLVTIRRSTFSANQAGGEGGAALYIAGSSIELQVDDSVFDSNIVTGNSASAGGAINLQQVRSSTVLRSVFSSNSGGGGGAFRSVNPVQMLDSRFVDNTATFGGGALWIGSDALIDQSTFDSNRVLSNDPADIGGGAIRFAGANLDVMRSTFSNNNAFRGGAITVAATTRLRILGSTFVAPSFLAVGTQGTVLRILDNDPSHNLIVANSIFRGSCTFPSVGRILNAARGNIESPGSTCRFDTATANGQNQLSATLTQINLGSLGDNGGPTPTRLPGPASIAINQGSELYCLATDQRHFARTDAFCDVGAVEVGAIADKIFQSGFESP